MVHLPLESSSRRGRLDTKVNTNNTNNTILPFDAKNAVKWNASYLPGFTDLLPIFRSRLI